MKASNIFSRTMIKSDKNNHTNDDLNQERKKENESVYQCSRCKYRSFSIKQIFIMFWFESFLKTKLKV